MDKELLIKHAIETTISVKESILKDEEILRLIKETSQTMVSAFKSGKKVLFCGNGGSAADAQHLAAELSGKFYLDRDPLPAEPLNINTSFMTAVSNDLSYDVAFSRLIKAVGQPGDVLVALSTSGKSSNIIKALEMANSLGMITVGFSGQTGGNMVDLCKYLIKVPSTDTPRIQEAHTLIGHIICEITEREIFGVEEA
jgi:D-sedoheptulose 7-phosphate isomerase